MANEEHLAILEHGVAIWNQWRKKHQRVTPDLRYANLSQVHLRQANLRQANLRRADLSAANLRQANLRQANLSAANLSYADLSAANLRHANLRHANLIGADLRYAGLTGAGLTGADLTGADLSYASLIGADLGYTTLSQANFADARIGRTALVNVDLSEIKGMETIAHWGPSNIGIDTIYLSKGNIPYKFLLNAGVPKDDIDYLLRAGKAIDYYSCFISYSSPDQAFAERLHADLQAKGVRCWYAPEDLTIGEPFRLGIDKGIRLHEKFLLVLSEHSINSGLVQAEVFSALDKEQGKEPWVLFPVRLDDTVLHTSVPWANMIKPRHIGDFTQWKDHDAYQKAFDRLLRDLKMGEIG